jgi:hypothetical protein
MRSLISQKYYVIRIKGWWCPESASRSKRLLDIMSSKQREILNGPESGYYVKIGYCCSRKIFDVLDCYCICQSNKLLQ